MKLRLVFAVLVLVTLAVVWVISAAVFWLFNQPDDAAVVLGFGLAAALFVFIPGLYVWVWRRYVKPFFSKEKK